MHNAYYSQSQFEQVNACIGVHPVTHIPAVLGQLLSETQVKARGLLSGRCPGLCGYITIATMGELWWAHSCDALTGNVGV